MGPLGPSGIVNPWLGSQNLTAEDEDVKRQALRRALLLGTFLLLPVTLNYYSLTSWWKAPRRA